MSRGAPDLECPDCGNTESEMYFAYRSWSCRLCNYEIGFDERESLQVNNE